MKYWDLVKVASFGPLDSPHPLAVQHTCCVQTNKHFARHGDAIHLCHLTHTDMKHVTLCPKCQKHAKRSCLQVILRGMPDSHMPLSFQTV